MAFDVSKEWASSEKEKSDYPDIKYWDELNYNYDEAANDRGSGKFPKKLRFLEDANGRLIPEHRLDDMRAHLLHTFEEIRLLMPSLLSFNGWLKCDEKLQTMCYAQMRNWYSNYIKSRKKDDSSASEAEDEIEVMAIIPAKRALPSDSKGKKSRKKFKKERGTEDAKVESDGVEGVSDIDTHLTQVIDPLTKLLAPSNWINASTPSTSSALTASLNASTTSQSASTTSLSALMTTKKTSTTMKTTSATVKTPAVMAETSATATTNTTSKTMKTTTKSVARTAKEKTTTSKTLNIPITSNTASKSTPSSSTATKSSMTAATVPIVPMITKPANSTSLTLRIPAIRTVPENPASSAAPVVAPKPKPVYRNKQFKIPQPHSVTIQEDQLDQRKSRPSTV
ncbi:hypothetical protein M378DRAFT_17695 [Amanita muscaria Koide BX008]|uniref:Uncharacterized protein n=1 Tax=Amanita muscaria (strain Koide BX008) TaxID=946122 RepID=A0A0C2SNZ5_AMAMK|nr:hypothetical protein M378DRAFT_17695 [Amanita muscaria Koide BX008]